MALNVDELRAALEEHVTLEASFSSHGYDGNNRLEIELKFDGETIATASCTVDPTKDRSYY